MPIFYSVIARNNETILVESNMSSGNYPQLTMKYLKSNKAGDGFKTFSSQDYTYYLFNERPMTYLCLCETGFSKTKCLTYLKDLRNQFMDMTTDQERDYTMAYGLNQRFENIMAERIKYYNESSDHDGNLKSLVGQLQDVQIVMQTNLDNIEERGQKIAVLKEATSHMKNQATVFNTRAKRVKDRKKWENLWKKIIICLLFWIVIYAILCIICGGFELPKCA